MSCISTLVATWGNSTRVSWFNVFKSAFFAFSKAA